MRPTTATITIKLGQPDPRGLDAMIEWIAAQLAAEVIAECEQVNQSDESPLGVP